MSIIDGMGRKDGNIFLVAKHLEDEVNFGWASSLPNEEVFCWAINIGPLTSQHQDHQKTRWLMQICPIFIQKNLNYKDLSISPTISRMNAKRSYKPAHIV